MNLRKCMQDYSSTAQEAIEPPKSNFKGNYYY